MTSAVSWVAKMFEPSWPQLNPYLSQTADDKAWQLMQAEASQHEPRGAWLLTNKLTRSAQDRANCKWGTRERSGGSKIVGEFQRIAGLPRVVKCAVTARRTRSSTLGTGPSQQRWKVCASIAKGWQLNLLQQGYS